MKRSVSPSRFSVDVELISVVSWIKNEIRFHYEKV